MSLPRCDLTDLPRLLCGCHEHNEWAFDFEDLTPEEQNYLSGNVSAGSVSTPVMGRLVSLTEYRGGRWLEPRQVKVGQSDRACTVPSCDRPAATDSFICPQCVEEFEVALGNIAALAEDLMVLAAKQAKVTVRSKPLERPEHTRWDAVLKQGQGRLLAGRGFNARPDVPHAGHLLSQLQNAVSTGIRMLCENRGLTPPVVAEVVSGSRWLLTNLQAVTADEGGGDLIADVLRLTERAQQAIDTAPTGVYLGVCTECQSKMFADPDAQWHKCRTCGSQYDVQERRAEITDAVRNSLLTLGEIERHSKQHLGQHVTIGRLRRWVKDKRLIRKGTAQRSNRPDGEEMSLYRMGDVLELIDPEQVA